MNVNRSHVYGSFLRLSCMRFSWCALIAFASIAYSASSSIALTSVVNQNIQVDSSWNRASATAYLDQRMERWIHNMGSIDHGTFCVSCHTALPYALARYRLRSSVDFNKISPVEQELLNSVTKRVRFWNEVQPFLNQPARSHGSESVINALVLAIYDAHNTALNEDTKKAFDIMWGEQMKSGANAGAWQWFNFYNEPWEAPDSQYWGATLAAIAVGTLPRSYGYSTAVKGDIQLLESYIQRGEPKQSLFNRLSALWADDKLPGLLNKEQKEAIVKQAIALQHSDGGWSPSDLVSSNWGRHDGTPQVSVSDGYATAYVTYVLEQTGVPGARGAIRSARHWLTRNQNQTSGFWRAQSWNTTRDPSTDVGKFMDDAATAYAVMALTSGKT